MLLVLPCLLHGVLAHAEPSTKVGRFEGGDAIEAGATIKVPAGTSQRVVLEGGTQVTLYGGTEAVLGRPQWYPAEEGSKAVRGSLVYLRSGAMTVRLAPDAAKPMAASVISTVGQTALIWRGVTHVVARDGEMRVAVDDGSAYVGAETRWLRVKAGGALFMGKKAPPETYKSRLAAVESASCGEGGLGVTAGSEKGRARVCWKPTAAASAYRVDIASDEQMTHLVESVEATTAASTVDARLAPGTYWARVFAIGADGVPSAASTAVPVKVLRAELPPGAVVANDGSIVLPPEGSLRMDATGLSAVTSPGQDVPSAIMAARSRTAFTPAPATFGLAGHRVRVVRLRDQTGSEARLVLTARELRARVTMTPDGARWPADPIDVSVDLEDPTHRLDPSKENVTCEVFVDSQPTAATWTREGGSFHARIAPMEGPGPWFVRVVVRDAAGADIGSRVVDLDGRKPLDVGAFTKQRQAARDAAWVAAASSNR